MNATHPVRWAATSGAALALALAAGALLGGCGGDSSGPNQPPPPDVSSPRAAIRTLADLYGRREYASVVTLHTPDFRFHPAQPESIPFLAPGETFWDFDREKQILERMLVPERITWLDQVLLEVHLDEVVDSTATLTRITADTELIFLVGEVQLVHSRSSVDFFYEKASDGSWLLAEQRESVVPGSDLTVGQLKTQVEDPPSVATLVAEPDSITSTTAILTGRVNPNGLPTTYWFEWGTTEAYGSSSTPQSAGSGIAAVEYDLPLSGLTPNTLYHYRFVATSLWGTSRGQDLLFTTDP